MSSFRSIIGLGLLALPVASAQLPENPAPQAPPPVLAPATNTNAVDIPATITALGSKDYRDREKAGQVLLALGERVRPALQKALSTSDRPEVTRRIEVLLARLDIDRLTRPTLVSLSLKNATPKTAFRELGRASGYEFKCPVAGWNDKLKLELVDRPFWEAVTRIEDQTGAGLNYLENERLFQVIPTESTNPYTHVNGVFRFTAQAIHSNRSVQLARIPRRGGMIQPESVSMTVSIESEPKTVLLSLGRIKLKKAIDDMDTSMIIQEDTDDVALPANPTENFAKSHQMTLNLYLNRGHRNANVVKEVSGEVQVHLLSAERPEIVVLKPAEAEKKRFAGHSVDLEINKSSFDEQTGQVAMTITFRQREAIQQGDTSWTNSLMQRLCLMDELGRECAADGVSEASHGEGVFRVSLSFVMPMAGGKKPKAPARLEFREWVTETKDASFSFKNVPLDTQIKDNR